MKKVCIVTDCIAVIIEFSSRYLNVDRHNSFINQSSDLVCIRALLKCLTQVTYFTAKMDITQRVKLMTTCQGSLATGS